MKKLLMFTAAALVLTAPAAFAAEGKTKKSFFEKFTSSSEKPAVKVEGAKAEGTHEGKPRKSNNFLDKIDSNKDGDVTKEEFLKFHEARFAELDTNGDGKVTQAETDAKRAARQEKMKEMREKRKAEKAAEAAKKPVAEEKPAVEDKPVEAAPVVEEKVEEKAPEAVEEKSE